MSGPWFQPGDLFCPTCGDALDLSDQGLRCSEGHTWPVLSGIANLVPADLSEVVRKTVDSFAFKWAYDPVSTFEERDRVATFWFYDRFRSLPDEAGLARLLSDKKRCLDVGCGLGNLTTTFARVAPHAQVWGLDLSPAVYEFRRLHGDLPNVRLVRGDLFRLPVGGQFDFIVADGVLHHTTSTKGAFEALASKLAPGGDFLFYVYKKKAPIREFSDDWLREHTTKMSPEDCMAFCRGLVDLGRQLREARVTLTIKEPIPLLGIPAGEMDLQRWVYWHLLKCFWDDGGNMTASLLENFDWYHPTIAWRHTPEEVQSWLTEAGLDTIQIVAADSGISVWCRKPKEQAPE